MNTSVHPINSESSSNGTNEETYLYSDMEFIVYGIAVPVVLLFGYIGNIMTAIVLWRKEMASITNIFLRALVISDIAMITFTSMALSIPTLISECVDPDLGFQVIWPRGFKTVDYLVLATQLCNEYILVFVSLERYMAICHPLKHAYMHTRRKVIVSICGIVGFGLMYNVPRLFATDIRPTTCFDVQSKFHCFSIDSTDVGKSFYYKIVYALWMYTAIYFLVPLLALIILNILITRKLAKMRIRRSNLEARASGVKKDNITVVLVLIVTVFTVCQTLGLFSQFEFLITQQTNHNASVQTNFSVIVNLLYIVNSSINFLIYICVGRKFQENFAAVFKLKRKNTTCCYTGKAYKLSSGNTLK